MTVCTKRFGTPFGYIEVLQNGIPVEFEITSEINGYDRVWIDDETVLYPDGLYEIIIPIEKTNPRDVLNRTIKNVKTLSILLKQSHICKSV